MPSSIIQGTTVVDNLLNSDDVHYMLGALRTLGLHVEDNSQLKRAVVEGCGGHFPVGRKSKNVELFLGNAGTAMRPLTAAVTAAGGNSRCLSSSLSTIYAAFNQCMWKFSTLTLLKWLMELLFYNLLSCPTLFEFKLDAELIPPTWKFQA